MMTSEEGLAVLSLRMFKSYSYVHATHKITFRSTKHTTKRLSLQRDSKLEDLAEKSDEESLLPIAYPILILNLDPGDPEY